MAFFQGFALEHVEAGEATLRVRHGGDGPPVVLLHGHPRTHATWHRVAALLAPQHTVVCPDLRGYGGSSHPPELPDHATYSKRAMARDVVDVMRRLGHERFGLVGHDRGACVAYRLALDHPDAVSQLAILEGIPLLERLERADWRFALSWWHWFFFGQTAKPAEEIINADSDAWYRPTPDLMGVEAYADLRAALRRPEVVHAMVEDYRAGLGVDREADRAAGRRIRCPLLVVSALQDDPELDYGDDPVTIWRAWADDVRGAEIDCGHHMSEEAPDELARLLLDFFAR
ncbi:MAG TPA: alpha/beta hydrolase [Gaiellaceae bacterium]|nr:alpha/beta hydrolase [Gaiellaceae bacterium]